MKSNPRLDIAYRYAQYTNRNIFLTGKAGTGKTTFLRHLKRHAAKRMIVVAPTGVAAINAGGVTIHSFFQFAPGMFLPGDILKKGHDKSKYNYSRHKINILRSIDLLVIDEISMVRADLLDAIDHILRRYQNRNLPFGGVQLLMIGDLQQLAPVTTDEEWQILKEHYASPYFFSSLALRQTDYTTIELTEVYRQADQTFVELLNNVRDNRVSAETLHLLNSRYIPGFTPRDEEGYIILTTHNYQAQEINNRKLEDLPTYPLTYKAKVSGDFPAMSYPTDEELILKIGAQVMFCKNDPSPEKRYYNGKIGRVVHLTQKAVTVACSRDDDEEEMLIEVGRQEWVNARYVTDAQSGEISEEIVGTYTQIPLKTAWAITIHKSQGLTFSKVIINAGSAFSHGQVYVALSRCRTLEGIVLSTPISASVIKSDPNIISYNRFIEENQPSPTQLSIDENRYIEQTICLLFDFDSLDMRLRYVLRLADEHLSKTYPAYIAQLQLVASEEAEKLLKVGKSFAQQVHQLMALSNEYATNTHLHERVKKAIAYYTRTTAEVLGDCIEAGLPEIENKQVREQMEREFSLLKSDYDLKMLLFIKCVKGFDLKAYWDAKACMAMQQEDLPTGKTKSKASKTKTTTDKKKKTPKSIDAEILQSIADKESKFDILADIHHRPLYNALRDWRTETATQLGVPPYMIIPNKALISIANMLPTTSKEFLAVPGFGKKMLTTYGSTLLEMITRYKEQKGID